MTATKTRKSSKPAKATKTTKGKATKAAPVASKTTKQPVACWCGCGGHTAPRPASKQNKPAFLPGHDARAHGQAKKVARGELDGKAIIATLPSNEAKVEFASHVNAEKAKIAAAAKK